MIADLARADGSEIDNLRKLFDFNRDSICVKILSMIGLKLGDVKTLSRAELMTALAPNSPCYKWLDANCKFICETFGVKITRLPAANDGLYLKKILEFINGKLKSRYDVCVKQTGINTNIYYLEDSFAKLFNNDFSIPEPII
jgi:hypothetical protein